jgi:hypothetical protein
LFGRGGVGWVERWGEVRVCMYSGFALIWVWFEDGRGVILRVCFFGEEGESMCWQVEVACHVK